jgi:transposase
MVLMKALSISDASTVVLGLQDEIRRSEESRYDHRLHGVLLVAQGYSCGEVARLLGSAPRTVEYWVHRFEQWGLGGLREGSRSGRPGRLSAEQIRATQAALRQRPADFGLSGNLWDGKTLSAYLEEQYAVQLSARQCRRFFRQWEFRLRKPRPVIARADPERQMAYKKTPGAGRRSRGGPVGAR